MTAVVTGASGLLGREVVRLLSLRGTDPVPLRGRFSSAAGVGCVPIAVPEIAEVLGKCLPQQVFHLAGIAHTSSVAESYQVNALYAAVLLDAMEATGLANCTLVLVGSAAEYGPMEAATLPAREVGPVQPAGFYGASKLAQTELGLAAASQGRRVLMVRPSNLIGPGMPKHLALGSFVKQLGAIARGEREPVLEVGDLSGSRDLIDVYDAAEFIIRLAGTPAALGQIVNISTGRAVTMFDVVQRLLDMFERRGHGKVRIQQKSISATAASSSVHFSCNRRLVSLLGNVEYTPLEMTLTRMLDAEIG